MTEAEQSRNNRGAEEEEANTLAPWSTTHDRCSSTSTPESLATQLFLWLSEVDVVLKSIGNWRCGGVAVAK